MPTSIAPAGRRAVLRGAAGFTGLVALETLAAALTGAAAASPVARRIDSSPDYGPLHGVRDHTTGLKLIKLPYGFEYLSYGWTGDVMDDGVRTPHQHDGMAAFAQQGQLTLVRNHEIYAYSGSFASPAYDPYAGGGTTTLRFDPHAGMFHGSWASLSGTIRNCAGGPTPWDSWLSCEETLSTNEVNGLRHGYVFEVPAGEPGTAAPIIGMGRFSHEAVAVDPATGWIYLTEDAHRAGCYRFRPAIAGLLHAGGDLEMMVVAEPGYDTRYDDTGTSYPHIGWVPVAEPDPDPPLRVFDQGVTQGAATFRRLEGAFAASGYIYLVSTDGGPAGQGQVFEYDPVRETMRVVIASPKSTVLNHPDNICVSPRGGILLCEDGSGVEYLHGLTREGKIFRFAANDIDIPPQGVPGRPQIAPGDYRDSEWCGATFSPDGKWLFVNLQQPGITCAITGPWERGSL